MKTLVIVAHPDLAHSRANRPLVDAVADLPQVTVRHLDAVYPDRRIDVATEQAIVAPFPRLVLYGVPNVPGMAVPPDAQLPIDAFAAQYRALLAT